VSVALSLAGTVDDHLSLVVPAAIVPK